MVGLLCRVVQSYTVSLDKSLGYPGINTMSGYLGISYVILTKFRLSQDNLGQPSFEILFSSKCGLSQNKIVITWFMQVFVMHMQVFVTQVKPGYPGISWDIPG